MKTPFDRIVCISLRRREDRRKRLVAHLDAIGWPWQAPELFMAVDGRKVPLPEWWTAGGGAWGCMQSHRQVLEQAITDGAERLLVLEDDVFFVEGFAEKAAAFLSAAPADWEQLMLGGQFQNRGGHERLYEKLTEEVYRVAGVERTHCYAVQGQYMRDLYAKWTHSSGHCDHVMGPFQHGRRVYAPKDWLAGQAEGKSDIGNESSARRWVSQIDSEKPVYWIDGPDPLRGERYHSGYSRNNDGVCVGLAGIPAMPHADAVKALRRWVGMIRWEAASPSPELKSAIWCPGIPEAVVREACPAVEVIRRETPAVAQPKACGGCGGEKAGNIDRTDPKSWGPSMWREFHKSRPGLDPQKELEWLEGFIDRIPCPECKERFQNTVAGSPPELSSRGAFDQWKVGVHNEVNRELGKSLLTFEQAVAARPADLSKLRERADVCVECEHYKQATSTERPLCKRDGKPLKPKMSTGTCDKWPGYVEPATTNLLPMNTELVAAPAVFYHVAAMNHWRSVADEQLALLASAGLNFIHCTFLGKPDELEDLKALADRHGVTLKIEHSGPGITDAEKHAMLAIERWSKDNGGTVLYLHTKGVSAPWHKGRELWREQMQREVVAKWRQNLALLESLDLVGCNWNPGTNWMQMGGHMAGNFWMARADYIRKLPSFVEYQAARGGHRWACEDWIGKAEPRLREIASWDGRFAQQHEAQPRLRLLYIHQGTGDLLTNCGLVLALSERWGGEILLPVAERNEEVARFLYRDRPEIRILGVKHGFNETDHIFSPDADAELDMVRGICSEHGLSTEISSDWSGGGDFYCVGHAKLGNYDLSKNSVDQAMYLQAGVPAERRFDGFCLRRDTDREEELFSKVVGDGGDYVFVHEDRTRGYGIQVESQLRIINNDPSWPIQFLGLVLERAKALYCFDSSIRCLIEAPCFDMSGVKLFWSQCRGTLTHFTRHKWTFI